MTSTPVTTPVTSTARVHRVIVSVDDAARAVAFYRATLGAQLTREVPGFAFLRTSDGVELLLHQRPAVPSDTSVAVGFFVDDPDAAVASAVANGGSVVDPVTAQPWGERMATVRDADGHLLCLSGPALAG